MPRGPQVDYEPVAQRFDERYAVSPLVDVADALIDVAREAQARSALEVGCGTGRWLAALRAGVPDIFGLDPSPAMLWRARQALPAATLVRGRANGLPFAGESFDLVYCVNAHHQFDDPLGFVTEAAGLLRPGGTLCVAGLDVHAPGARWYLWDYFDGTRALDLGRFPRWNSVAEQMRRVGLSNTQRSVVDHWNEPLRGRSALGHYFLRKDAASQLILLTDDEYAAGMRRMECAVEEAEADGHEAEFSIDLELVMLRARRPTT